jgi:hypothetical protein
MKIYIELDEEMEEKWTCVKRELESALRYYYKVSITLPNNLVFLGLLDGFANELVDMQFPGRFTKTELEAMKKGNL